MLVAAPLADGDDEAGRVWSRRSGDLVRGRFGIFSPILQVRQSGLTGRRTALPKVVAYNLTSALDQHSPSRAAFFLLLCSALAPFSLICGALLSTSSVLADMWRCDPIGVHAAAPMPQNLYHFDTAPRH